MTRLPRLYHPKAATICFYADGDYRFYLECLGEATRPQPAGQAAATDTLSL